jgi:hypothetical protein
MDAARFEKCLGKPEESPEVSQLLKDLGVTKKLKLSGEDYTKVELPKLGVSMSFSRVEPKSSKLMLSAFELNAGGKHGVQRFAGKLMRGLEFDDLKKDVRKKLGKPTDALDEFDMDHWDVDDDKQFTVGYSKTGSISYVILGLIDEDEDDEDEDDED